MRSEELQGEAPFLATSMILATLALLHVSECRVCVKSVIHSRPQLSDVFTRAIHPLRDVAIRELA